MVQLKSIRGTCFSLRSWHRSDAESLVRHANNIRIARNFRDGFPHPYTLADARSWIEMIMNNEKDHVFAIEIDNEACGGIGLHPMTDVYRYNAELGYWLSEQFWGKGIASEAVGLMVDYAFRTQHWERIFAGVFSNNLASMKVLERNGFTREAIHRQAVRKDSEFMDEIIFSLLRKEWRERQASSKPDRSPS